MVMHETYVMGPWVGGGVDSTDMIDYYCFFIYLQDDRCVHQSMNIALSAADVDTEGEHVLPVPQDPQRYLF